MNRVRSEEASRARMMGGADEAVLGVQLRHTGR